jgi:hypothetical protein
LDNPQKDFFIAVLELGKGLIIFDGLDEIVNVARRNSIVKEIERFSITYPNFDIWVTSRTYGYKNTDGFNPKVFEHFYLARLTPEQAEKFIQDWYGYQIPENLLRKTIIENLINAFTKFPQLRWFRGNPLFLTMLVMLNRKKNIFPENRLTLYEQFLELILKTWPDKKFKGKNPLEERGIDYGTQLKLLSKIANFIHSKDQISPSDSESGTISNGKMRNIVSDALLFLYKSTKEAIQDDSINEFIKFMTDRTGFLVEQRKEKIAEKEESIFSFIHYSFVPYFDVLHKTSDRNIADKKHIDFLINYIKKGPPQEDFILLLLHALAQQRAYFLGSFYNEFFKTFKNEKKSDVWLILGYAMRDNIKFDIDASKQIIEILFENWLENVAVEVYKEPDASPAPLFSILTDIAKYSIRYRAILKEVAIKYINASRSASRVFASLYFLWFDREERLLDKIEEKEEGREPIFHIDNEVLDALFNHFRKDKFLPYLPVFRYGRMLRGDNELLEFIETNLEVPHWTQYYISASERPLYIIDKVLAFQMSSNELTGYILSAWSKILTSFQKRHLFLTNNKIYPENGSGFDSISFGVQGERFTRPLKIFRDFLESPFNCYVSKIKNKLFLLRDRSHDDTLRGKMEFVADFIYYLIIKSFENFNRNIPSGKKYSDVEWTGIVKIGRELKDLFCINFKKYFTQKFKPLLNEYFQDFQDLEHRYLYTNYKDYLQDYFNKEVSKLIGDGLFKNPLIFSVSQFFAVRLQNHLGRDAKKELDETVTHGFLDCVLKEKCVSQCSSEKSPDYLDLKKAILKIYGQYIHKRIDVENLEGNDYRSIYRILTGEFSKDNVLLGKFYSCWYEHLFIHSSELSFKDPKTDKSKSIPDRILVFPRFHFSISSPYIIPFLFNFILGGDMHHYLIKLLADLSGEFFGKPRPDTQVLLDAMNDYLFENSFICYFINYSWPLFCKKFNEHYQKGNISNPLFLAALILNAARIVLVTETPCLGKEWYKILINAAKSDNIYVKISLTLYELCIFEEKENNSELLKQLLEEFRKDYSTYYQLLGITL